MSNLKLPSLAYSDLRNVRAEAMYEQRPALLKVAYATTLGAQTGLDSDQPIHVMHHGNVIATLTQNSIHIDTCGWSSVTTLARLDRILQDNGVPFRIARRQGSAILDMGLHVIGRDFREATFSKVGDAWRLSWADVTINHNATARV